MKHTRKLLSLLLALVMVFALAGTAMAAENTTISAPAGSTRTYDVYQIFTGDLHEGVLSNIKWGKNGTGTEGNAVDQTTLDNLAAVNSLSDTEKLAEIQKHVNLSSTAIGTVSANNPLTVTTGYYLIKDNGPVGNGEAYSLYVVEIVGPTTISPKSDVPEFEKKLKDTNDTAGVTSDWQDSADWDIGDKVPFQLKGTVASNYDAYKTYYFAFHDIEEASLTFDSASVKVYVDGTLITTGYAVVTNPDDSCTFEVIFEDLKEIESVHASSVITVEYESTLNGNANLGNKGNVNKAKLEFSNNPYQEQGGTPETGETPWDNVIVFTYQVVVNKYANSVGDDNKLAGAEFTLEKVLKDGTKETIAVVKSDDGTSFTFKGLDDGNYILTETTTPDGYNTIAPITFTVTAEHTITWDGTNRTDVLTSLSGNAVSGEITLTASEKKDSLSTDVINKSGTELPTTGGIGTTIFYVLGSVLVLAAVVLLVTKKRMSTNG